MLTDAVDAHELVKVAGRGALVNFEIDDSVPVEVACRALREHLGRNRHLYARGDVTVNIGRRILRDDQQARIQKVIEGESGLTIKQFWCQPDILEEERQRITNLLAAQAVTVRQHAVPGDSTEAGESIPDANEPIPEVTDAVAAAHSDTDGVAVGGLIPGGERYGVPALVVRGTCRAGEVLQFPGNVVILGNVNPGAQIIAAGDILVFGGLRGLAHAGAGGDTTAIILAMSTASPSLRIAEYFWHDEGPRTISGRRPNDDGGAIIARVRNGAIHVAPYLRNYAINHGGNPNER